MSDLLADNAPSGATGASRARNASSRPNPSGGRSAAGQTGFLTPTQIMAQRTAREQARRNQQAAQQQRQEPDSARQKTDDVVGVAENARQISGRSAQAGTTAGATQTSAAATARRGNENVPTTNGGGTQTNRPPARPQQQSAEQSYTGQIKQNRTEAYDKLSSTPAVAGAPKPPQPQAANYPAPTASAQPSVRTGFPHAFERWEMLSSHWEGITSSWIRRLESNADELSGKPIDQQMARQVTDLSAAGANLFHAVVELQRLRASSERKFQRWFFETRNEQEQTQEQIAQLEAQLRNQRQSGNASSASIEAVKAEKSKSDELVREMRRELQISKEEARRAWEELGRREQEERERTMALRNGEPTLIGGVQVVPMAGMARHMGSNSRPQTRGGPIPGGPGPTQMSGQVPQQQQPRETYSRSQTTLESPELEQEQFTYQPGATSPTGTDPFTETSGVREQPHLRHEPDTRFYSSPPRVPAQPAAPAAAVRSTISPSRSQTESTSPSRFYQQAATSTTVYQPITATAPAPRDILSPTERSENRSYIPSSASGQGSDDEYHINPDGSYTLDAQGRRIPSNQPISGPGVEEDGVEEDEDDEDYTAEVERERYLAQQYSQRQAAAAAAASPRGSSNAFSPPGSTHRTMTVPAAQIQTSPGSRSYSSTISATSQPMTQVMSPSYAENETSGYSTTPPTRRPTAEDDDIPSNIVTGWENINVPPRHHHPSRLSAIIEERSGRTSPSRTSYASETNPSSQRGVGSFATMTGYAGTAAAARRRYSPEQEDNE